MKAALAFLAIRDRSEARLSEHLLKKGQSPDVAEEVVSWLKSKGLLNDERRATTFAAGLQTSGKYGKQKLRERLIGEGISEEIVEAAVAAIPDDSEIDAIRSLLAKKKYRGNEKAKAWRFLAGRQFSEENIDQGLNEYFGSD